MPEQEQTTDQTTDDNIKTHEFGSISVKLSYSENQGEISSLADVRDRYGHLKEKPKEYCYAVYLQGDNAVIGDKLIGAGNPQQTAIDVTDVSRTAIMANAVAVILVHNHPSWDSSPSKEDIDSTKKIKKALDRFGIDLLDHVIIGETCYSMKRHGQL